MKGQLVKKTDWKIVPIVIIIIIVIGFGLLGGSYTNLYMNTKTSLLNEDWFYAGVQTLQTCKEQVAKVLLGIDSADCGECLPRDASTQDGTIIKTQDGTIIKIYQSLD